MTFVRRKLNPMKVKKTNVVKAEPNSVAESGDAAAAGYDCNDSVQPNSNKKRYSDGNKRTATIHHAEPT